MQRGPLSHANRNHMLLLRPHTGKTLETQKAEIWKAENGGDTGAQISSESSGLTHNYTQVKTLFVHTRIKLLNRKTMVVGAGLHSTSFTSWSLGGSINPTIASPNFTSNTTFSSSLSNSYSQQAPGMAHTSTQVLRGLHPHSCYILVPTHLTVLLHSSVHWILTTPL